MLVLAKLSRIFYFQQQLGRPKLLSRVSPRQSQINHQSTIDNRTIIALAALCGSLGLFLMCWMTWYYFYRSRRPAETTAPEEEQELEAWDPRDFAYPERSWPKLVSDIGSAPAAVSQHETRRHSSWSVSRSRWSSSTESLNISSLGDDEESNPTGGSPHHSFTQLELGSEDGSSNTQSQDATPAVPRKSSKRRGKRLSRRSHARVPSISEVHAFNFGFSQTTTSIPVHIAELPQPQRVLRRMETRINLNSTEKEQPEWSY